MMETQERIMFQIAIGALASVIGVLFGYLVKDHGECRRDRLELRKLFEDAMGKLNFIEGQMAVYKSVFRKLNIKLPGSVMETEEQA